MAVRTVDTCKSCGIRLIAQGSVVFDCPECGEQQLGRCPQCRDQGVAYQCPACKFTGP